MDGQYYESNGHKVLVNAESQLEHHIYFDPVTTGEHELASLEMMTKKIISLTEDLVDYKVFIDHFMADTDTILSTSHTHGQNWKKPIGVPIEQACLRCAAERRLRQVIQAMKVSHTTISL